MSDDHGSDICACGEYRSQHPQNGPCSLCANSRAPYDGCKAFRLSRKANDVDLAHWKKYHLPRLKSDHMGNAIVESHPPAESQQSGESVEEKIARDIAYARKWKKSDAWLAVTLASYALPDSSPKQPASAREESPVIDTAVWCWQWLKTHHGKDFSGQRIFRVEAAIAVEMCEAYASHVTASLRAERDEARKTITRLLHQHGCEFVANCAICKKATAITRGAALQPQVELPEKGEKNG